MSNTVLIAGCGDLGNALGQHLIRRQLTVHGLRRNIDQLSTGIHPIVYDLSSDSAPPLLPAVDYLVYTAAAKSRDLETYRRVYLEAPVQLIQQLPTAPKRVFLVGSTGVYAQNQHEWIDETSVATPNTPYAELLLAGEQAVAELGIPVTVTRCSGIYGPGRNHLLNRIRVGIIAPKAPLHYSNRIHRDDAAAFLDHLIGLDQQGVPLESLYLASDNEPTPIHEVTLWLAQQLGIKPTQEEVIARGGSKQIDNRRMRETGYALQYRNYKEGFSALLNPQ